MSQAMPRGRPGEGSRESLTMGMRAWGRGLTWNFVSGQGGAIREGARKRAVGGGHDRGGGAETSSGGSEQRTALQQVTEHGDEVGGGEAFIRVDQAAQVHIWKGEVREGRGMKGQG